MKNVKYVLTPFTFYDRTGIQRMLERQAEKGWVLEKIGPFLWKYRRTETKKLHYAVTYYHKISQFDPSPNIAAEIYQDFVSQSGWEFAASVGPLQIFYTGEENPVPIETDALLEIDNIHRSVKKSYLPAYIMLLGISILQISNRIPEFLNRTVDVLANNMSLLALLSMVLLFITEAWEIGGYYIWRYRAIKQAKLDGTFLETGGGGRASVLGLIALGLLVVMIFQAPDRRMTGPLLFYFLGLLALIGVIAWLLHYMKENGAHPVDSKIIVVIAAVIGSLLLTFVYSIYLRQATDDTWTEIPSEDYYFEGVRHNRYLDPIPLGIPELTGAEEKLFSSRSHWENSILLSRVSVNTVAIKTVEDGKQMRYEVLSLKLPFLKGLCLRDCKGRYQDSRTVVLYGEYQSIAPAPWGAERAWQLYRNGSREQDYILCYANTLIHITFNWEPSPEQKAIVGSVLTDEQNFENIVNN